MMFAGKMTRVALNQRPNNVQQAAGARDFVVLHTGNRQGIKGLV